MHFYKKADLDNIFSDLLIDANLCQKCFDIYSEYLRILFSVYFAFNFNQKKYEKFFNGSLENIHSKITISELTNPEIKSIILLSSTFEKIKNIDFNEKSFKNRFEVHIIEKSYTNIEDNINEIAFSLSSDFFIKYIKNESSELTISNDKLQYAKTITELIKLYYPDIIQSP